MLEVKKKNLDRREWYKDTDRSFACRFIKDDFFEGGVGLITFTGIEKPDEVDTPDGGRLCIADKGYQWLELAPVGECYVITSMFCGDRIFQHYVDITLRNEVNENGDAVFYDLFLDVVLAENGEVGVIDTEELDEAYATGVISADEYEQAKRTAREVVRLFSEKKNLIEEKLFEYRTQFSSRGAE